MTILVDDREPERIIKKAHQTWNNVEIERLPIADFVCGRVAIERKAIEDFAASVKDGRVFRQAENMVQNYERPFVIIVGEHSKLYFNKMFRTFSYKQYVASMASIEARTGCSVIEVKNDKAFFDRCTLLFEKGNDGERELSRVVTQLPKHENVLVKMLTGIPNVGVAKAERIVEHFQAKTICELCQYTKKDFMQVKGIGKVQAERIVEHIR